MRILNFYYIKNNSTIKVYKFDALVRPKKIKQANAA